MTDLYTKVPKWVMVGLIRGNLKLHEVQVLAYVLEKTVAFNEDAAHLTPKRIAEATGIGNHVYSALNSLIEKGVLVESDQGIGPTKELQNLDSKIWSNSLQNLEKKTPKSGVATPRKSAHSNEPGKPKKTIKETTKQIPPQSPLSENEIVRDWIRDVFCVSTVGEAKKLSEEAKAALRDILSYPEAAQERAVKAYRSWRGDPIRYPVTVIFKILKNPAEYPIFESNIIDFEKPHEWAHKPWACLYKPKEFKGREHQEVLGLGHIVGTYGTGCFHETDRIYRAHGFEAAMDYVWDHHPRNGYHKNKTARAQ